MIEPSFPKNIIISYTYMQYLESECIYIYNQEIDKHYQHYSSMYIRNSSRHYDCCHKMAHYVLYLCPYQCMVAVTQYSISNKIQSGN